jgi:hypothetical protein
MPFDQQRRAAERLPLDAPIEATASGVPVRIVELSAIGCRIEHREKLSINSTTRLRFTWKARPVDLSAKIARQQLMPGMVYSSGLQFAKSLDAAPEVVREIVTTITAEVLPPEVVDVTSPEDEIVDAGENFMECSFVNGKWQKRIVTRVKQPLEGFITMPGEESELDLLCRTYEYADPETRRLIRISLELAATKKRD